MTLHEHRMAVLEPQLAPGEEVVHIHAQRMWYALPGGTFTIGVCALGASMLALALATGRASPFMRDVAPVLFAALVVTPFLLALPARGRSFVATTRRLLIVRGAKTRSIDVSEMRAVEHSASTSGVGALRLQHGPERAVRWETFRGIDEVAMLARALELAISHADLQAFSSRAFFRRELDESELGPPQLGSILLAILIPFLATLTTILAGKYHYTLLVALILWGAAYDAVRRWLRARHRAVHFLEVNAEGVSFCIYTTHLLAPHVRKTERVIPFADIEEIRIQLLWRTLASQRVVARGESIEMPAHLLASDASVVRFVRTVEHYVPHLVISGDVVMLASEPE